MNDEGSILMWSTFHFCSLFELPFCLQANQLALQALNLPTLISQTVGLPSNAKKRKRSDKGLRDSTRKEKRAPTRVSLRNKGFAPGTLMSSVTSLRDVF